MMLLAYSAFITIVALVAFFMYFCTCHDLQYEQKQRREAWDEYRKEKAKRYELRKAIDRVYEDSFDQ